ncbi:MAG TPA: C39 family peptidase [Tepidisphaeraceae bacterium]|nr:C39 family peptidase [Tepidisphaeraceae bacterium]
MTAQRPTIVLLSFITLMVFTIPARAETPSPIATTQPASDSSSHPWRSENPPGIVDRLEQVTDVDAWSAGALVNANVFPDNPARVELGYRESDYPRSGSWTGPIKETAYPFDELIASFNVTTPAQGGAVLEIRVLQAGVWSPWVYMQCWGKTLASPGRVTQWDGGRVKVDTLMLDKPATQYQARVTLVSFSYDRGAPKPSIRRLSVCYSGVVSDTQRRASLLSQTNPSTQPSDGNWVRDLGVPYRAQGEDAIPKSLRKLICSPTSTSMVLAYYGTDRPTLDNASAIYDPVYGLFGNWGRAISRAGEVGLDAYLTRFRNWDQVHAMIARGIPVVASIRFNKGEVKGFLYESTRGHLLVIRGFKPNGDVIVNDPARKEKGNGVVYPADQFAKAWFDHGGVAYVVQRPESGASVARKGEDNARK